MTGFEIREFVSDDIDAALRLWRRTEGVGLSDADQPGRLREFLARNPGAVAADSRRKGVGRALLDAALSALRRTGIGKCHVFVFQSNPFGDWFWARSGWQRRDDLYVFSRNLDPEVQPAGCGIP